MGQSDVGSTVELGYSMLDTLGEKMEREKVKVMKAKRIKGEPRPETTSVIDTVVETAKAAVASITGNAEPPNKKRWDAKTVQRHSQR